MLKKRAKIERAVVSRLVSHPICKLTPLELFARQTSHANLFWLDGGVADTGWSYFGAEPQAGMQVLQSKSGSHKLLHMLKSLREVDCAPSERDPDRPPFMGGWVGFLSYPEGLSGSDAMCVPRVAAKRFDSVLAYSHEKREWWTAGTDISNSSASTHNAPVHDKVKRMLEHFAPAAKSPLLLTPPSRRRASSNFNRADFEALVRAAKAYIAAGDIYQVNLAQRLSVPWDASPAELYVLMRQQSPAEFGAFLGGGWLGDQGAVCSLSPELFLRVRGRNVLTCPIKGTRPRSDVVELDTLARLQLETSAKERAELNMIVDLERNDLGRVCEFGSVRVEQAGEVRQLPTLYHRIATVSGALCRTNSILSLLRATFPGGSITGAPKIRAMQLIDELEPCPRGLYCGAIGWLGFNGDMELSIAIRTAVYDAQSRRVSYHAGSGIVADSDPAAEYDETLHKAAAFLRALNAEF
jgi:para-aminobenzoate synthetase component 1